jgi:hypothetical protein
MATDAGRRPISVSNSTEMPSVKRPFAACGKLALTLDEFAGTQGVRSYGWETLVAFFSPPFGCIANS